MKIAVFGATGMIGRSLVPTLEQITRSSPYRAARRTAWTPA